MASGGKPSSRYSSYDLRSSTSSHFSDPSSSSEFKHKSSVPTKSCSSRAIVKSKPLDLAQTRTKGKVEPNLTTMVKKFIEKKSSIKPKAGHPAGLVIASDLIAEDLKKNARKANGFTSLQKKLFGKASSEKEKKQVKALTEVKGNTRTLAMVLRSERELLSMNKEQEMEISELKMLLEEKNREVEKLKDMCLNQREEIKSLKSAILFPDVMNSQLHELLEKQGSELTQAKQVIPTLQRQVTSLTGQLQSLAEDLAEVKADKYSGMACLQHNGSTPGTPRYSQDDASNSLEFSSEDLTNPGSPDDLFVKDLNPCLTPYSTKTRLRELDYPQNGSLSGSGIQMCSEIGFNSYSRKLSRSSDCCCQNKST
ncbi:Structural maintenance of chromosomes protein [Quillaja saponaria]|uniref:Structural maintenance of chromosomes protein n=1 Tax=Quillaja saponaria TaxID=32244 RepID=A0AAD7M116_QUISA|nr:Structural maintenance of chromosomes protein [Quillaja saponaria]KAJ7967819.1 Structural maintenance of chromosomes protein [Quillaja saponaria]